MDTPDPLFQEEQVDKTPYGACFMVVLLVGVLTSTAALLLWRGAELVKSSWHRVQPSLTLPTVSPPDLQQTTKQQVNAAQEALRKEAESRAQKEIETATNTVEETIKNTLPSPSPTFISNPLSDR